MKCFVCGKEMNEFAMIILNIDGDLACSKRCKDKYDHNKQIFFDNISSDEWWNNWWNEKSVDEVRKERKDKLNRLNENDL